MPAAIDCGRWRWCGPAHYVDYCCSRREPSTSTGEDECVTRGHCRSRTRDSKSAVKEAEQPTRDHGVLEETVAAQINQAALSANNGAKERSGQD